MGPCVSAATNRQQSDPKSSTEQKEESQILHLIYMDLAQRIPAGKINLDNFLLFFHKNGYWGERLFREFDYDETGLLSEPQFIDGVTRIVKSSQKQKISLLFKFFSEGHNEQGVDFREFLTMLYNYPKDDLCQILNDRDFIEQELKAHLLPIDSEHKEIGSYYSLQSTADIKHHLPHHHNLPNSSSHLSEQQKKDDVPSLIGREVAKALRKKGSEGMIRLSCEGEVLNISAINIQQVAKMFAVKMFKQAEVDIFNGRLNFQQFYRWNCSHPALFQNYYEGFHNDIWENADAKPKFSLSHDKVSNAKLLLNNKLLEVKLALKQPILTVCSFTNINCPFMVLCLDGLIVRKIFEEESGFGLSISHRDQIYSEKKIFLKDETLLQEWLDLLQFYKGNQIQDRYQIGESIGRGKFSVVHKCTCFEDNQEYALKEISSYQLEPEMKRLIAHESSIMQVVSHPLLLNFKESIQTKTHIYIVTELVQGTDLFDYVRRKQHLPEKEAAKLCQQIIVGVRFLHSLQIVHRDLKPENIMVVLNQETQEAKNIKIIDFGLSNYLFKLHPSVAECDNMVGTPNFIAPEVLKEEPFDYKIDNFAIGVILAFMLTGALPFCSLNITETLQNIMSGKYWLCDSVELSSEAVDLIRQLLANNPLERITLEKALQHKWFSILSPKTTF